MKIFLSISSILWINFFFISQCECPEVNDGVQGSVAENPVEQDPLEANFEFKCENLARKPMRTFEVGSRGHKVQTDLGYLGKPDWPSQWIMTEEIFKVEGHIYAPSMGIVNMHFSKYKGENVGVVIIANSAVNCDHEQIHLRCNADKTSGYSMYPRKSFFSFTSAKKYRKCSPKSLATAVAGIIGMTDEGQRCGVGIAPKSILGNIVIQPSTSSGSPENCAHKMSSDSRVALFVHAWQMPQHDYRNRILHPWGHFDYMNLVFGESYLQLKPHVMGAGDLGLIANSCQTNEYTSSDSSLVFGSVAYNGFLTPYSETCASLMGVTYSTSHGFEFYNEIATIPSSDNILPSYAPKGTTAVSAAVAGGIVALIIDYYRKRNEGKTPSVSDLTFLLAFSANSDHLQNKNMLWFTNAAGLKYSPQGGFGLPHLARAVDLINAWTPIGVPRLYKCSRFDSTVRFNCVVENNERKSSTYSSNMVCNFSILDVSPTLLIQSVTVQISAKLIKRGSMSVNLTSPGGTVSCLLEGRPYDTTRDNYKRLRLRSNHFMGESLMGPWMIKIFTYKEKSKPTFHPLYAFRTGSEGPSPPPISPFPLNSGGDPKNPVPTDFSAPSSINPAVLPPASTQGLPLSQSSEGPSDSHPALPVGANSVGDQRSPRTDHGSQPSQNSVTSFQPAPAAGASPQTVRVPDSNPHFNQEDTESTSKLTSVSNGGSKNGAPPNGQPAPAAGASPKKVRFKDNNPHFNWEDTEPTPKPTSVSNGGSKNGAPPNGPPAANPPAKPSAARTKVPSGRTSPAYRNRPHNQERIPNEVGQISLKFVLVESLPHALKIAQKPKFKDQTQFDFELLKLWADFRQYLLVQTDPQNYGTSIVELKEVYGIMNIFIQKLLMIQSNSNFKSGAGIPADVLNTLTGADGHPLHPPLQHSDSLARQGVHPHVSPGQKIQNGGVPSETQRKPDVKEGEHQASPTSAAQQSQ